VSPTRFEVGVWRKGALAQHRLDADAAQHLHRIGSIWMPAPITAELMRLFVNLDVDARLPKRAAASHTAHSGAHDCDFGDAMTSATSLCKHEGRPNPPPCRQWRSC